MSNQIKFLRHAAAAVLCHVKLHPTGWLASPLAKRRRFRHLRFFVHFLSGTLLVG